MKKKLFLITDCYPFGKGEKSFLEPELPFLIEKFDVTVVSCASNLIKRDSSSISELPKGIKLISFSTNKKDINFFYLFFLLLISLFSIIWWKEFFCILKEKENVFHRVISSLRFLVLSKCFSKSLIKKVDISNAVLYTYWHNTKTLGLCLLKKYYKNIVIVSRVHGYDLYEERAPWGRQCFRWYVNNNIDALFFISNKGLKYYLNRNSIDNKKVFVCPLGINDIPNCNKTKNNKEFVLVSCSSVIPLKRIDLIVRGLALVDSEIKIKWIHFGDGFELSFINALSRDLFKNKNNISYELRGWTDNKDIRHFYSKNYIDCFITTSSTEGMPVSIQEAMCSSIPIIGTNVGGISDVIKGNGILLDSNPSVEEVSSAIAKMAKLSLSQKKIMQERSRRIWSDCFNANLNFRRFTEILTTMMR